MPAESPWTARGSGTARPTERTANPPANAGVIGGPLSLVALAIRPNAVLHKGGGDSFVGVVSVSAVLAGLGPATHAPRHRQIGFSWMPGPSPGKSCPISKLTHYPPGCLRAAYHAIVAILPATPRQFLLGKTIRCGAAYRLCGKTALV